MKITIDQIKSSILDGTFGIDSTKDFKKLAFDTAELAIQQAEEIERLREAVKICRNTFEQAKQEAETVLLVESMKPEKYQDNTIKMAIKTKLPAIEYHIKIIDKALNNTKEWYD